MSVGFSAVADTAWSLKKGRNKLFFRDGGLWLSNGSTEIRIDVYNPSTDTAMLPEADDGSIVYRMQTILSCFEGIIKILVDFQKHVSFEGGVALLDFGKTITEILGGSTEVSLVTLDYYNEHRSELVGPQGEQGPQGVQGIQGPPGENSVSNIQYRGPYDSNTAYIMNDVVVGEDGNAYALTVGSLSNVAPPNPEYWALFVMKGAAGPQGVMGPEGPRGDTGPTGAPALSNKVNWAGAIILANQTTLVNNVPVFPQGTDTRQDWGEIVAPADGYLFLTASYYCSLRDAGHWMRIDPIINDKAIGYYTLPNEYDPVNPPATTHRSPFCMGPFRLSKGDRFRMFGGDDYANITWTCESAQATFIPLVDQPDTLTEFTNDLSIDLSIIKQDVSKLKNNDIPKLVGRSSSFSGTSYVIQYVFKGDTSAIVFGGYYLGDSSTATPFTPIYANGITLYSATIPNYDNQLINVKFNTNSDLTILEGTLWNESFSPTNPLTIENHILEDSNIRWPATNKAIVDLRAELKQFVIDTYAGTTPLYDYTQRVTILQAGGLVNLANQGTYTIPVNGAIQGQVGGLLGVGLTVMVNGVNKWTSPVNLLVPLNSDEIPVNAGDQVSYGGVVGIGQTIEISYFPNKGLIIN